MSVATIARSGAKGPSKVTGSGGFSTTRWINYQRQHPVRKVDFRNPGLDDCVKLVILNTNGTTVVEMWGELHKILDEGSYASIAKVQRVQYRSNRPCFHVWVRGDVSQQIVRVIRDMTKERTPTLVGAIKEAGLAGLNPSPKNVHSWRVALWREWRDRDDPPERGIGIPRPTSYAIGSWNVNGFHSKKREIAEAMRLQNIGIMAIQETLSSESNYPVVIDGYTTFAAPRREGFRGQALLVDSRWSSYTIPHEGEFYQYIIHVKVSNIKAIGTPIHVFAVYLPSGGNFRKHRRKTVVELKKQSALIMRNEPNAPVVILGDFNYSAEDLDFQLSKGTSVVYRSVPVGSGLTRFPKGGVKSSLDHFVVNQPMHRFLRKPRVLRQFAISDHRLVVSYIRQVAKPGETHSTITSAPRMTYDNQMIYRNSEGIVHHNKWNVLVSSEIDSLPKLSQAGETFGKVFNNVVEEFDVKRPVQESEKRYLPKHLKRLYEKYREYSERVAEGCAKGQNPVQNRKLMGKALQRFKYKRECWERRKEYERIADLASNFAANDQKLVWKDLRSRVNKEAGRSAFNPVRDKGGVLQLSEEGIVNATREHYRVLAQDDEDYKSRSPSYWDRIDLGEGRPDLEGINLPLRWKEALLAIRGMNRNTAPGKDGVHVNVLKILLREECLVQLKELNPNFRRPDGVWVDLPEDKLPSTPLTPMGKALFKVLKGTWDLEQTPEIWNEVYIANLFKSGDPELLVNYRGISLISCAMKVVLCIMVERLSQAIEKADLIVPEQAGFRKREEAVAQFTAIAEVVRRRRISGKDTFGVFIDFKKAYDKVHHHALYRVCEHMGVRGKMLNLIKYIYSHSDMTIRTGGYLSKPFRMYRGVRQGCPLSPLLFILFINTALVESSAGGVDVPGTGSDGPDRGILIHDPPQVCKGGMYADDLVLLEDSAWNSRLACRRMYEWCQKWGMELGTGKCGVQCWSDKPETLQEYSETNYYTPSGVIPKVTKYKYLGIVVDETFGQSRGTLGTKSWEFQHSKVLSQRGAGVLSTFKPLFMDRSIPIPLKVAVVRTFLIPKMTYGSEAIGFKQLHAEPAQKVVNIALRWILGRPGNDKSLCVTTASYELGIPRIEEVMAGLRARLHYKLDLKDGAGLKSWIQTWHDNPFKHRQSTWVTTNRKWIKETLLGDPKLVLPADRYNPAVYDASGHGLKKYSMSSDGQDHPLRPWAERGRNAEMHSRSNPYESDWIGYRESLYRKYTRLGEYVGENGELLDAIRDGTLYDPDVEAERMVHSYALQTPGDRPNKIRVRNIRDCVLERSMESCDTHTFEWYDRYSMGATRDYLRWSINRPDLTEGIRWLCAIRCGVFPRVRESQRIRGTHPNTRIRFGNPEVCPLCEGDLRVGWEWAHLMTSCSHAKVKASRRFLDKDVKPWWYQRLFRINPDTGLSEDDPGAIDNFIQSDENMFGVNLGGFKSYDELRALHLAGGIVADAFDHEISLGFGHVLLIPEGMKAHLYVYVAQFLQEVAPLWCLKVRWTAYGENSDSGTSGGTDS